MTSVVFFSFKVSGFSSCVFRFGPFQGYGLRNLGFGVAVSRSFDCSGIADWVTSTHRLHSSSSLGLTKWNYYGAYG